jgi:hypothetical protein
LTDGVWISMPPLPLEYQGRELASRFLASVAFRAGQRWQLVPTRANGQPAFGAYIRSQQDGLSHALGLLVLTLAGDKISAITMFDKSTLPLFGLPRTLPACTPSRAPSEQAIEPAGPKSTRSRRARPRAARSATDISAIPRIDL